MGVSFVWVVVVLFVPFACSWTILYHFSRHGAKKIQQVSGVSWCLSFRIGGEWRWHSYVPSGKLTWQWKWAFWRCIPYWKLVFSNVMLVYWSVYLSMIFEWKQSHGSRSWGTWEFTCCNPKLVVCPYCPFLKSEHLTIFTHISWQFDSSVTSMIAPFRHHTFSWTQPHLSAASWNLEVIKPWRIKKTWRARWIRWPLKREFFAFALEDRMGSLWS